MNAMFYVKAGELICHEHRTEERIHPHNGARYNAYVVRFTYERGWAEFDGSAWKGGLL